MLSEQDVQKIISAPEGRGYGVYRKDGGAQKVILDKKHFRRIEKFTGEAGKWQEWLFRVCVAVSGLSVECCRAMEEVVKVTSKRSLPQTSRIASGRSCSASCVR